MTSAGPQGRTAERLVALATGLVSVAYLVLALDLPTGTIHRPGSGFFPQLAATLGIVFSMMAGLFATPRYAPVVDRPTLLFMPAVVAFAATVEPLGFIPSGILFTGVLVWLLGSRRIAEIAAIALAAPLVLDLLFSRAFDLKLPRGLLGG